MPFQRNRKDGVTGPIKSLHQMLGHDSGTLTPIPVYRLDECMNHVSSSKSGSKGRNGGIKISGKVGEQKTMTFLPSVKRPKPTKQKKG